MRLRYSHLDFNIFLVKDGICKFQHDAEGHKNVFTLMTYSLDIESSDSVRDKEDELCRLKQMKDNSFLSG